MLKVEISKQELEREGFVSIRGDADSYLFEATRIVSLCGGCCSCPHGLGAEVTIVEPVPPPEGSEIG